jgi:hypothetical protein
MFQTLVIAATLGALLGLRFKVFKVLVLATAFAIGMVVVAIAGITYDIGGWSIVRLMVVAVIGLQVGYLGGAAMTLIPR